ncbi:MAG: helix-turn-helix domain-containing protein [Thermoguttaceae bacterium]
MVAPTIALEAGEARRLRRICQARSAAQAKVFRARLVLRCAEPDDPTNWQVAVEFGCDPDTVSKWRRRFAAKRLDGLDDAPRSGRPRSFSP